ncbi:putative glucuronosyltransferase [Dichanthelium oligosanthes]|uniref:Glycosyltransferases n=1 Tax=Dichanthelium oligosanthes TaxID=888268 RepID=A0A1E5WFQ9_9POAL|nr:putative glucuronosyltransferase [Dichanthelium oligosanthes]
MEPAERSKKRVQPWIKAAVHFSLCFAIGALTALAPLVATGAPSAANTRASFIGPFNNAQRTAAAPPSPPVPDLGLLLIVTVTRPDGGMEQDASLARLAHTLRHVAPPLLWIVVGAENRTATARAVRVLRGTGVMFRHLTYDARNFTGADAGEEEDHQRNAAMTHIERHRLNGVVLFAGASSIYDLRFFQELRQTRGFAAWPVATISPAEQRITVEGPTCNLSQITGWYSKDSSTNGTQRIPTSTGAADTSARDRNSSSEPPKINISGIGFRSSVLWDSERSPIRRNSSAGATQDFIQIVQQMAIKDENKLKGITSDCFESQIMLWHLDMPRFTLIPEEQETQEQQSLMARDDDKLTT